MASRPVYLASDVHLGAIPPSGEEAFLSWLARVPDEASGLILNGDLFDFWFEYRWGGVPRGHDRALESIREVVSAGVPVTLMGGNHDWWGGRYLRDEIGVEFLQDPVVREYAGYRTFLAHGDGLGKGDLGYRIMRLVLRGGLTRFGFSLLGPGLGGWVAGRVSKTDERLGAPTPEDQARAEALAQWAAGVLERDPSLDLVALGHTHVPMLKEVGPGRWYLNTGDWVHHRSYAVLEEGRPPRLLTWGG